VSTLVHFVVVCCELYIVFFVLAALFGLLNLGGFRTSPYYPLGANLVYNVGGLIVAIAIVAVFGHGGFFLGGGL